MDRVVAELKIIVAGIGGICRDYHRLLTGAGRQFWTFWLVFLASGLVVLVLVNAVPEYIGAKYRATTKQNLHAIQLGLERFAVDSPGGNYPLRIEQIIEDGYLPAMPRNPFTGLPTQWKVYASYDEAATNPDSLSPGDFAYVPASYGRRRLTSEDLASLEADEIDFYELVLY